MIYEAHRKVNDNVGDYYCNPGRYFDFPDYTSGELMHNNFPVTGNTVVIGGGGLIHKKFQLHIQQILDKNPRISVLWGIGHNFSKKHIEKTIGDVYYPKWLQQCSLVGIRDWIEGHHDTYLPCVSCMHPAFDKTYKTKHKIVYFTHAFKSKYSGLDAPHLSNDEMDIERVIEFLGSGKTVVTDSYHGAYWAQLLRKNVIVSSWSVKFDHMKYAPAFISSINDTLPSVNNSIDGFLEECRTFNKNFYQKFLNLL
jgi:hypothetical protein